MSQTRRQFLRVGSMVAAGSLLTPTILNAASPQSVDVADDLDITPSKTSSQNDFDFFVGTWKIHSKKLKVRLKNSNEWVESEAANEAAKILNGFGVINRYRAQINGAPFEGLGLYLFNPQTKLWTIYWADSNTVALDVPLVGSFEKKVGTFYANDTFNGKPIIVRYIYTVTNPNLVVWEQAFSPDNGKTFETNWIFTFNRQT